ncbi:MAG: PQQ-like beta-propeller repeat protein [Pirellulaceae bacterium]|nr:PQQ-like beta-propeller repeat protein [Pirellulaceae bacterium]
MRQTGPPPPFEAVCFESWEPRDGGPSAEELRQWFEPVEGDALRIDETRNRWGRIARLRGLARCRAPWSDETAVRLSLDSYDRLQLHFWSGRDGVTLVHTQRYRDSWAAYATRRAENGFRAERYALLAADGDRNFRTEIRQGGDYQLRCHAGRLILTRGDVVLLQAALPGPVEELIWDGDGSIQSLALLRSLAPDSSAPTATRRQGDSGLARLPGSLDTDRPADLTWHSDLPPAASVERLAGGALELQATQAQVRGQITTPLPALGPSEILLHVEGATPGSGIFLGREGGKPHEVLRYVLDPQSGQICLTLRNQDDLTQLGHPPATERILPAIGQRHWVRLVFGCGQLRWWIGGDGQNWAEPSQPTTRLPPGVTSLGLQHVARGSECRIRLLRLIVRPLPAFHALAPPALLERAEPQIGSANLGDWLAAVDDRQPADAPSDDWRHASAVRTLGAGPPDGLGQELLDWLLDEAQRREVPLVERLALLDECALLANLKDDRNRALRFLARYYQPDEPLAPIRPDSRPDSQDDSSGRDETPAIFRVRRALITSPVASPYVTGTLEPRWVRRQLLDGVYAGRWSETAEACRQLRFFRQETSQPLIAWAETVARAAMPGDASRGVSKRRADWEHPLWEGLSREAYNALAELRVPWRSEAWEELAGMIVALPPDAMQGLAPDAADDGRLVSLSAALREFQQRPELRQVLREKFGDLARLRVEQAIDQRDTAALELATRQLAGTEAATEAHRWLGDQALEQGWFARAEAEYERGLQSASSLLAPSLAARRRLAAALQGRSWGEPATGPVHLAGVSLEPREFESLVAEMRERAGSSEVGNLSDASGLVIPHYVPRDSHRWEPLDGPAGEQPAAEVVRASNQLGIAWVERQLAAARTQSRLLVSNRFQVSAYELDSGRRVWQTALPDKQPRSQDWTCIPMVPLVTGQSVFTRLLAATGPRLVCLDESTGELLWTGRLPASDTPVSDPFSARGEFYVLAMSRADDLHSVLRLVRFDPETGEVIGQHDLLALRDVWWTRRVCQVRLLEDRLFVVLGGIVLASDLDGSVVWVRQQVVLPPQEEPQWIEQYAQSPQVAAGRCLVAQPGVRAVDCIEADTGRLLWRQTLPDVRRLLGLTRELVVVETASRLLALRQADAALQWETALTDTLEARLCDDRYVVLAVRGAVEGQANRFQPRLQWLSSETGQPVGTLELPDLPAGSDPRLGPLIALGDRLLAFFGEQRGETRRELVELRPVP